MEEVMSFCSHGKLLNSQSHSPKFPKVRQHGERGATLVEIFLGNIPSKISEDVFWVGVHDGAFGMRVISRPVPGILHP